jgi:hypothetical protein
MGKRQTSRRRSRKRPTRKAQQKSQNRHSRRRQRGGVSDQHPTINTVDGTPIEKGALVTRGGVLMTVPEFLYRQQDGGDSFLD